MNTPKFHQHLNVKCSKSYSRNKQQTKLYYLHTTILAPLLCVYCNGDMTQSFISWDHIHQLNSKLTSSFICRHVRYLIAMDTREHFFLNTVTKTLTKEKGQAVILKYSVLKLSRTCILKKILLWPLLFHGCLQKIRILNNFQENPQILLRNFKRMSAFLSSK